MKVISADFYTFFNELIFYYHFCSGATNFLHLRTSGIFHIDINFKGRYGLPASPKIKKHRNNIQMSFLFFLKKTYCSALFTSKTNRL